MSNTTNQQLTASLSSPIMALFFVTMFIIGTDTFIVSPMLPTLRKVLHISIEQSGWLISAYALGYALFALIAGPLSDGLDRKLCLLGGMIGFSLFTALCGSTTSFSLLFAYRTLAGICAAIATPQVWASIPQLVAPQKIVKAMGAATAGLAVSQCLGVPLGSLLAASNWRFPFYAIGITALLITIVLALKLPSIPPTTKNRSSLGSLKQQYRTLFSRRSTVTTFLGYFLYQLGTFSTFSYLGNWLADDFSLNVQQTGLFILGFGIGNLAGSILVSKVERTLGIRRTVTSSLLGMIAMYVIVITGKDVIFISVAYALIALFGGMLFPLLMGTLQKEQPYARGTVAALANSTMYFATMLGSALAGELYTHFAGFSSIVIGTMLCYTASLIIFRGLLHNRRTVIGQANGAA
ncbi:MFS transporter [Paenibacillus alvei]|uniref:MFS transporter n=1 Tax=Paenibacillus alvei TaxID=44250 RepID=UPI00227ECA60|nr:MFS transporter [Paenibacillus alvei]MCY7484876.1 MFS transporter [Paenibacillus alvei]